MPVAIKSGESKLEMRRIAMAIEGFSDVRALSGPNLTPIRNELSSTRTSRQPGGKVLVALMSAHSS
jgi:hypothetical protein